MKIIVGLGNPGLKYRNTRHNVGFLTVMSLAERFGVRLKTKTFKGTLGKGRFRDEDIVLFMPSSFMNLSGESVALLAKRFRHNRGDMLLIYDDIDLRLGNIRMKKKGSSGGHKGVASVVEHLGTEEFPRLRIGIRGRERIEDVPGYVLSPFTSKEKKSVNEAIERCCDCVVAWIENGIEKAMNAFNKREP